MAAAILQSGIKKNPESADLWAALGVVLMLAGEGQITPPAKMAFVKARALSPKHPVPGYFEGLEVLFKGDLKKAISLWESVMANTPEKAKWRPRLESQLRGLKTLQPNKTEVFQD
jgi:cytochrome c-type biogenesis protein CcmH